jgi:hypothetical protein
LNIAASVSNFRTSLLIAVVARRLTLPDSGKIRILAISAVEEGSRVMYRGKTG